MPLDNKTLFKLDLSYAMAHTHTALVADRLAFSQFSQSAITHSLEFSRLSQFPAFSSRSARHPCTNNDGDAGYGNIAPVTEEGKIATIFYAIIGMPLFLLYLSNIGNLLS